MRWNDGDTGSSTSLLKEEGWVGLAPWAERRRRNSVHGVTTSPAASNPVHLDAYADGSSKWSFGRPSIPPPLAMTVPIVRKRARRPKVRTGCRTCRARRIKCGEEKPTCRNCALSKRECAGYDIVKPHAQSRLARLQPNDELLSTVRPVLTYCLSTLPQGLKARDGYALDYFLRSAFQDLPGSSWTLSWDRLILPFCRSDPAILHAAMAIGSLQQTASQEDLLGVDQDRLFVALSQYGRSTSLVRNAIEKHAEKKSALDVESILTASLLLFCFEILHGQDEYAAMHLRSGLKILYEHTGAPRSEVVQISHERPIELQVAARSRLQLLTQTFVRLDSDLSQLGDRETFLSPVCSKPVPVTLDSLEEAMVYVDVLQSQVCDVGGELDDLARAKLSVTYPGFEVLDEDLHDVLVLAASRTVCIKDLPKLAVRMEETKQSLRDLMAALATLPSSPGGKPDPRRMLVEIHLFFVWFDASVWRDADEMEMDRFDQQFEHIMGLCEQYFASDKGHSAASGLTKPRPSFAMGTSVGQMICLIVEKSRNSLLRRRGIKLLSEMDMRGAFDGAFLASFYQHVVETEEILAREMLGLPDGHVFRFSEIPEAARFFEVDVAGIDPCDDLYYKAEIARMVYARVEEGELKAGDYLFPVTRPFVIE